MKKQALKIPLPNEIFGEFIKQEEFLILAVIFLLMQEKTADEFLLLMLGYILIEGIEHKI